MTSNAPSATPPARSSIGKWITRIFIVIVLLLIGFVVQVNSCLESGRRVDCAHNLVEIGAALAAYAESHDAHYPENLAQLLLTGEHATWMFICPSTTDDIDPDANTPAKAAASLSGPTRLSYLYLAKGLTTSAPPQTILVADKPENHNDGVNVLYADGHVDFVGKSIAKSDPVLGPLFTKPPTTAPTP